jgi:hypothetical protein
MRSKAGRAYKDIARKFQNTKVVPADLSSEPEPSDDGAKKAKEKSFRLFHRKEYSYEI